MFEDNIRTLDSLISEYEVVDFATKRDWDQNHLISEAEKDLGFALSKSYKWWLNHYKGGSIGFDQEIFSLYGDMAEFASADLVKNYQSQTKHSLLPENALVFFEPYGEEIYFFDVQPEKEEHEVFVVYRLERFAEFYAGDFIDFMIKYITVLMGRPL